MNKKIVVSKKFIFFVTVKAIFRNRIQKLVAWLLILAVGLCIVDNVVFLHSHKLSNGQIIIHAHPYDKSQDSTPFKKHSHTTKELLQISHLHLLFVIFVFLSVLVSFIGHRKDCFFVLPHVCFKYYFRLKGREPPCVVFS